MVSRRTSITNRNAATPPRIALSARAPWNTVTGSSVNQCTGDRSVAYPGCQVLWSCIVHVTPPPMNRDMASWAGSSGQSENSSRPRDTQ